MKEKLTSSSTLPTKLEQLSFGEWNKVDELLQVERQTDDKEKLYQTMPAGIILKSLEPYSEVLCNTDSKQYQPEISKLVFFI